MSDFGYAEGLGLVEERELREALAHPAARLVRKAAAPPAAPPEDRGGELRTAAAPAAVVGDIVEHAPCADAAVVFHLPKSDILFSSWPEVPAVMRPEAHAAADPPPSQVAAPAPTFEAEPTTLAADLDELTKKLAWTENCDWDEKDPLASELGELRFDFRGQLVAPYTYDLASGVAAALDGELLGLNCHGRMAYLPGYSLPELLMLLSSMSDQQVLIALRVLRALLRQRVVVQPGASRFKLDYRRVHSAITLPRAEALRDLSQYVASEVSVPSAAAFGFGLKRFNEYVTRSLMLHERLVLVALKSSNPQVVDLALMTLAALLTDTQADFLNRLETLLPASDAANDLGVSYCAFLTSRRSVMRRETFASTLLSSADFDLSEELKFAIVGETVEKPASGEEAAVAELELEHRRTDALLSLLLWGEPGTDCELLKLIIARLALSTEPELGVACFKIFQALTLHSTFAANYLHQFLLTHRDDKGRTCVRVVCQKFTDEWLTSDASLEAPEGLLEMLRFIKLDSLACSEACTSLLENGPEDVLQVDSLLWRLVMTHFDCDQRSLGPDSLPDVLKLLVFGQSDVDSGSNLLALYEPLITYFGSADVTSAEKLKSLSALLDAGRMEFSINEPQAALSFGSFLAQQAQRALPMVLEAGDLEPTFRWRLAAQICKHFSLLLINVSSSDAEYQAERSELFKSAVKAILKNKLDVIQALEVNLVAELNDLTPSEIRRDSEDLNLMDYTPFVSVLDKAPRTVAVAHQLHFMSSFLDLVQVLGGLDDDSRNSIRLLDGLRVSALRIYRDTAAFPGRKRFGVNVSDHDCFTLTNPLLDSWAQLFCRLVQTQKVAVVDTDVVFLGCAFRVSTARQIVTLVNPKLPEDDWQVLSPLACGYGYDSQPEGFIETEEEAEAAALNKLAKEPLKSTLFATNFLQVYASPFTGRTLYSLGADYSEVLMMVGSRLLARSAELLSSVGLGAVWIYELLETMAEREIKIDWTALERLTTHVLYGDANLAAAMRCSAAAPATAGEDGPILATLRREWNELYIHNVKEKLFVALKSAAEADRCFRRLRMVWIWLLSNCQLLPLRVSVWFDSDFMALCVKNLEPDSSAESTHVCGIPVSAFACLGNATTRAQVAGAVKKVVADSSSQDTTISCFSLIKLISDLVI